MTRKDQDYQYRTLLQNLERRLHSNCTSHVAREDPGAAARAQAHTYPPLVSKGDRVHHMPLTLSAAISVTTASSLQRSHALQWIWPQMAAASQNEMSNAVFAVYSSANVLPF